MNTTLDARDRLIVALDCDSGQARELARSFQGTVRWVKVGMTLFYQAGPAVVTELREDGYDVFLDLKLHDIPHQVEGAAEAVARLGAQMLTVHASGGPEMIAAAAIGAERGASLAGVPRPTVLAVTVLTSMNDATLHSVGIHRETAEQVELLAAMAISAGADGIVCSPHEASAARRIVGPDGPVVTPGVRPEWSDSGDQKRVTTPRAALDLGASHLVVGRPITDASDPATAARRIMAEMEEGAA